MFVAGIRLNLVLILLTAGIFGCDSQGGLEGTPVDGPCSRIDGSAAVLDITTPADTTLWIGPTGFGEFFPAAYIRNRCDWPLEFDFSIVEGSTVALDDRGSSAVVSALTLGESVVQVRVVIPATRDTIRFFRTYSVKDYCDHAESTSLNPYMPIQVGDTYRFEERRIETSMTVPEQIFEGILSVTVRGDRCRPEAFEFDVVEHFEGTRTSQFTDPDGEPVSWTQSETWVIREDILRLGVFTDVLGELEWPEEHAGTDTLRVDVWIPPGCCGGPGYANYMFVRGTGVVSAATAPPGVSRGGTSIMLSRIDPG